MKHPDTDILRTWLTANPNVFVFQEEDDRIHIHERITGKLRVIRDDEIQRIEQHANRETGRAYVIALLDNDAQLVFADQGFAFAPSFASTGPLPVPTSVFCMTDYAHIVAQVEAAEPERRRETVELVMVLIALLDGARAVGLEIGSEERHVERLLNAIESGES